MNLRQLECDENFIFEEQIVVANLMLADAKTSRRIIAVQVITAGLIEARVAIGFGSIPKFAFKILDAYMLERGFKSYKWERRRKCGTLKQVYRKIKVREHE